MPTFFRKGKNFYLFFLSLQSSGQLEKRAINVAPCQTSRPFLLHPCLPLPNPLFLSSFLPDCSLPFSVYVLLSQNSSCCPCLNPPSTSISTLPLLRLFAHIQSMRVVIGGGTVMTTGLLRMTALEKEREREGKW